VILHREIVHDDRELVREHPVAAAKHEVTAVAREVLRDRAEGTVSDRLAGAVREAQAERGVALERARGGSVAARAGVHASSPGWGALATRAISAREQSHG